MCHTVVRGSKFSPVLLAFDNYVPSQNYGGWFGERELTERRFSARWAPLCSEVKRTVRARLSSSFSFSSSTTSRRHFASLCTAAWLKATSVFLSHRFHGFLSIRASPIESRIYPYIRRISLGPLSASPFGEHHIHRSFVQTSLSSVFYSHTRAPIVRSIICSHAFLQQFSSVLFACASIDIIILVLQFAPFRLLSSSFFPFQSSFFVLILSFSPSSTIRFMKACDMG